MNLKLDDTERAALTKLLRDTIDGDRFPLAPRLDPLKAILGKLSPPLPKPQLTEPRQPITPPRLASRKRSRWPSAMP